MIARRFHALRLTPGSLSTLAAAHHHAGPVVVCLTHSSWWDPMLAFVLHTQCLRERQSLAPIDRDVLKNIGIFRKLGLFGIDPDHPASHQIMLGYVRERIAAMDRPTLWITPQGRFQDPRESMRVRPGVSAVLSQLERPRVFAVAAEYLFWDDKRPELLAHTVEIAPPATHDSTTAWHRAVSSAIRCAAQELASRAMSRDPAAFETSLGGDGGKTFVLYDWFLKLTGRSTDAIRTRRTT